MAITSPLSAGATAAVVQTALDTIAALSGKTEVIASATGSGGNVYRVIFTGFSTDQPQITATGSASVSIVTVANGGATPTNEVQQVTVRGASGTFKLGFGVDSTSDLTYTPPASPSDLSTLAGNVLSAINGTSRISALGGSVTVTAASAVGGTVFTVTFGGTLAGADVPQLIARQPLATITTQGDATHNEVQTLTLTSGSPNVTLSFTGSVAPASPAATPGSSGTLSAGTYFYKVSAVLLGGGETAGSAEVSAVTTGGTGSVALTWSAVPGASYYRVYRGDCDGCGERLAVYASSTSFTDMGAAGAAGTPPSTSSTTSTTGSLAWNADATTIHAALSALASVGGDNIAVAGSAGSYTFTFQNALGNKSVPALAVSTILPRNESQTLAINGAAGGTFTIGFDGDNDGIFNTASPLEKAIGHLGLDYVDAGSEHPDRAPGSHRHRLGQRLGHTGRDSVAVHDRLPGRARRLEHQAGHRQ